VAEITASMVMELRNKTGAKMMDAKRALVEADGDLEKAVALLRERGEAEAGKRQHRATAEGTIATTQTDDHSAASMVEMNCETDFVAKTDTFQALAAQAAAWLLGAQVDAVSIDDLPEAMQAAIKEAISKTGENIQFRRGIRFATANGVVESYIHLGGKIGVLVQIDGCACEPVRVLAKDIAMQVAAAVPEYLVREDVPAAVIASEMEIYRNQALTEGKKEEFLDRIAAGRLEKYYKDNCLLEQLFIKDTDKTIKTIVADVAKQVGKELTLVRFVRFQLGQ
jgi:elongation factor Ts